MFSRATASGAAVVAGAVAFLILLNLHVRSPIEVPLRADPRHPRQGFHAVERGADGLFAWTGPHAEFTLPGIDRNVDWHVAIDLRVWRPAGVPLPHVRIGVDGVDAADHAIRGDGVIDATAPRRPGATGLTIAIDTTPAFQPGPRDTRQLGVAVASIVLKPIGGTPGVPWRAMAHGTAALVILATAVAALGAPPLWIAAFALLVAWGEAALLAHGVGPYSEYPSRILALAAGLGTGMLAAVWSAGAIRRQRFSPAAIGAVAISLAGCYLKLLMLLHPDMPIGDGVFHAHRFEYVLAGRLYFTSLTPDNYAFPYPVFLYVVSSPFAWLTSDTLERVALLRIMVTVADAAAATLLYWMIVRATSDRLAGLAGVVWYHVIPMTAWIMTEGALTNAFAQTLFVASLAIVVGLPVDRARRGTIVALTVVAAAALLTHPSTCAILVGVLTATSALYAWHGGALRSAAAGVAVAAASAAAVAIALYYAWFPSVYVSELGRAASASVSGAAAPAASLGARLARAAWFGNIYFGWPAAAAAAIGAWRLARHSSSPRLTQLLVGWAGICVAFLGVGILTPVEMRYHFAAFPALAIAAGFACSWAWRGGAAARVAVSALLVFGVWDGIAQWAWALSTYAKLVK